MGFGVLMAWNDDRDGDTTKHNDKSRLFHRATITILMKNPVYPPPPHTFDFPETSHVKLPLPGLLTTIASSNSSSLNFGNLLA